jgi:16S rRNA (uracil1498-N3)-methyltransferase
MSERFYTNCPLQRGEVTLEGPEAHHLAVICRLRPGDALCLFNGDGREYPALVRATGKRMVTVEVTTVQEVNRELPFSLAVAAPLPRGDRAQFLIEKLTELGVQTYIPMHTQRSVVHPRDAKLEKLQRHVIEASKQCGRNVLMDIRPPMGWAEYCVETKSGSRLLAHPHAEERLPSPALLALAQVDNAPAIHIATGPEGGFSDAEVMQGKAEGWQLVDLGPRILRMETAPLLLVAWVIGFFFKKTVEICPVP